MSAFFLAFFCFFFFFFFLVACKQTTKAIGNEHSLLSCWNLYFWASSECPKLCRADYGRLFRTPSPPFVPSPSEFSGKNDSKDWGTRLFEDSFVKLDLIGRGTYGWIPSVVHVNEATCEACYVVLSCLFVGKCGEAETRKQNNLLLWRKSCLNPTRKGWTFFAVALQSLWLGFCYHK